MDFLAGKKHKIAKIFELPAEFFSAPFYHSRNLHSAGKKRLI
jgi:hypothetical protein